MPVGLSLREFVLRTLLSGLVLITGEAIGSRLHLRSGANDT